MTGPDTGPKHTEGQPGIASAALFGLCPRCSAPGLFEGPASIAPHCRACGLDFAALGSGGRIGMLLTLVIAVAIGAAAMALQDAFHPPLWLQAVFLVPITAAAVIAGLRMGKGMLLAARYRKRLDREGQ